MPPSVNKPTPREKQLRRNAFWRNLGHEPAAPNCYWAEPGSSGKSVCGPCAELRRKVLK